MVEEQVYRRILKTMSALGCYASSVITAVTAQNTKQVFCVQSVEATVVESQLRAVLTDLRPNAIKNRYGWLCKEYRNYCAGIGSIQDGSTRYRPCNGFYIWQ